MPTVTVFDTFYTVDEDVQEPYVHLVGRDEDRHHAHVVVEGFEPYFCVKQSDALGASQSLKDDERVRYVDTTDERTTTGEYVARIVTRLPEHVATLRESFDDTYEADVQYPLRFLVDTGITHQAEIHADYSDGPVSREQVTSGDDSDVEPARPRKCTYDIEVLQGDDGPSVVSERGTELARQPITAISAHDSYTGAYTLWLLTYDGWVGLVEDEIERRLHSLEARVSTSFFVDEGEMLTHFTSWLAERHFNVLQGWNSNSFDTPYLVNRCLELGVDPIHDVSPAGYVRSMSGDGSWLNSDLKGVVCFDLLEGYQKTQYRELDSYALENVAAAKTEYEKLDVGDLDDLWRQDPITFAEYSVRDTQATVAIDENTGII
jgi:DNA polymerase elongation subunit (family B)